jgi:HAMP domain-containing protein
VKRSFTFQTLIMITLAPLLALATAAWAILVYRSVHTTILRGFDRKLLALAGGTAAFIDGDAHARFQRRRMVRALVPWPDGTLVGADQAQGELIAIDTLGGVARPLAALPSAEVRAIAAGPNAMRLLALDADGRALTEFDPRSGVIFRRTPLAGEIDGLFADGADCVGWRGTRLFSIDAASGAVTARPEEWPEPVRAVAVDPVSHEWAALDRSGSALLLLDADGRLIRKVALHTAADSPAGGAGSAVVQQTPPPPLHVLAFQGGQLFGAGDSLFRVDPNTGAASRSGLAPGFFDVNEPFYRNTRLAVSSLQREAGLSYLYSQVYLGGKRIYYIMDGTTGPAYSPPGTTDELPATSVAGAEAVQFLGRAWMSPIQHWDVWGLLKSCFAPIRDSQGRVVAMAGADVNITAIRQKTRWALFDVVLVGVVVLVAAGFVSLAVTRSLTRPLREIKNSALGIAAGNFQTRVEPRGTREINELAHALNRLSEHLTLEEKRAGDYRRELDGRRRRAALQHVLADMAAGAESVSCGQPFRLGHGGRMLGADRRAVLWLMGGSAESSDEGCLQARATELARAMLDAPEAIAANAIPAVICASLPGLDASGFWSADTRVLYVCCREPWRLVVEEVAGIKRLMLPAGNSSLQVAVEQRVRWANPAEGHADAAAETLAPAHSPS